MSKKLQILFGLTILTLLPLVVMTLFYAALCFIIWEVPIFGWDFVRLGLVIGVVVTGVLLSSPDFRKELTR